MSLTEGKVNSGIESPMVKVLESILESAYGEVIVNSGTGSKHHVCL
jgi:hypothetical protein